MQKILVNVFYLLLLIFPYLANRMQCRIMIKRNSQTETEKKKSNCNFKEYNYFMKNEKLIYKTEEFNIKRGIKVYLKYFKFVAVILLFS